MSGNVYRNALALLKILMERYGNHHWAAYISEDLDVWDREQSVHHHQRAYGGMGSLNDVMIPITTPTDIWAGNLFESLKLVAFEFSNHRSVDPADLLAVESVMKLIGSKCALCRHAEVTAFELEDTLSWNRIRQLMVTLLPGKDFLRLADLQGLVDRPMVETFRNKLITGLPQSGITFNAERKGRMKPCPSCRNEDTMVYRWDVQLEQGVRFLPSKDNLSLS